MPNRKKPAHLKVLEGNTGRRPVKTPPKVTPSAKVPKAYAGIHKEVQAMYRKVAPDLHAAGLLEDIDVAGLEIALGHAVLARKALEELLGSEVVDEDRMHGRTRKHPAAQVFRDNSEAYMKWAKEFGMTSRARAEIAMPQPDDSEFERKSQPERREAAK